jgi:hypothetical protein
LKTGELKVRPATTQDYPAIASLLDRLFTPKGLETRARLWRWRYEDNPARSPQIPAFLVGERGKEIVAVHGLTTLRIKLGERIGLSACSCDFAVLPDARSAGMNMKLKALSGEISAFPLSTSANQAANKVTLALGGREFLKGRRTLMKPLRASGFVKKRMGAKAGIITKPFAAAASVVAGKALDLALALRRPFDSFSKVPNASIQTIQHFDERFDDLWELVSKDYQVAVARDSSYLNWRYAEYPFPGVHSCGLMLLDQLLGFAVIHNHVDEDGIRFATLLELLVPKGNTPVFEHLLSETVRRAVLAGAHYIKTKTSVTEWEELFIHHGFIARDETFSPVTYKNNTELPDGLFENSDNWYLSMGDGDHCYYF